jgi:hypothetical protein
MLRCISQNIWFFFRQEDTKCTGKCKDFVKKMLNAGFWMLDVGHCVLCVGIGIRDGGCMIWDTGCGVRDTGFGLLFCNTL